MKPTQKQIELIRTIESIVSSWKSTNDINSPTHYGDIEEMLKPFAIEEKEVEHVLLLSEIEANLNFILIAIKKLEKKPLTTEEKLEWLNKIKNDRENKETE